MSILTDVLSRIRSVPPIERQSVLSLFSTLVLTVFGFIATFYFAHTLGPAVLGGYFLFLAYYGIFDLIGDGGFGGAAVKRISEGREENEFFSAFIALRLLLLFFSLGALYLAQDFLVDLTAAGLFLPLLLALIIGSFYSATFNGIYGRSRVGLNRAGELFNFFSRIAIQIGAVYLGFGLGGLFGGFIIGMLAGGLFFGRYLDLRLVRFSRHHLASLVSFSFWIFLTAGGNLVFSISDVILIGYFLTNADVGVYRTAFQLTSAATFIAMAIQSVLYPRISRWSVSGAIDQIGKGLTRAFSYSLLLAVPVAVGGWVLGDSLLYFLYGAAFQVGAPALYVLLLVQILGVFMALQIMTLKALDKPRLSFQTTAVAATANVVLNLGLIPVIGILGAAVSTLVTTGTNVFLSYRYLRRSVPVVVDRSTVLHISVSALAMGILLFLIRQFVPMDSAVLLFGLVALGGLVYFVLLFRLNPGIYREIRDLVRQFGGPWPYWLDEYFT